MYGDIRLPKAVEEGGGEAGVSARPARTELLMALPEFADDVFEVKVKGEGGVKDGPEVAERRDLEQELSGAGGVAEGEGPVGRGAAEEGCG